MINRRIRVVGALVAVVLAVFVQAGAISVASATTPLRVTSITPSTVTLNITTVPGSAVKHYTVAWSGTATFPMTVHSIPAAGCSTSTWTCSSSTVKFTTRSSKLIMKSSCAVDAGTPPGSHTGTWNLQLVDAHGRKSQIVRHSQVCRWS
jgi:hypothetical protein